MDEVRTGPSGSIVLTWDAEKRLAVLSYELPTDTRGQNIHTLLDALERWVGDKHETFYFLNDAGPLLNLDTEWRAAWSEFFRPHRDDSWIALYNLSAVFTIVAEMYRVAGGLRVRVFAQEPQARAWLREKGARL